MRRSARRRRTQTQSARRSPARPYRLSGASTGSRGAPEDPVPERTAASSLNTSTVLLRPKKTFAPAAARADLPRDTATVQPDDLIEVEFEHGRAAVDARRRLPHQLRAGGSWPRRRRRRRSRSAADAADRLARSAKRAVPWRGPSRGSRCLVSILPANPPKAIGRRVDFPAAPSKKRQAPGRLYRCSTGHRGLRPHRNGPHRRHERRAVAAVPPRHALEHVGQFWRALVEAPRDAADALFAPPTAIASSRSSTPR